MGLRKVFFAALICCWGAGFAAPVLRLSNTALGPFIVAQGANGPTQIVDSANAGDGKLNLSLTPSASWLSATLGPSHTCSLRGNCVPIQIALNTSGLAAGAYTGTITVSDPNAIDAPQTITVTVNVGSGAAAQLKYFLPATGGTLSSTLFTAGRVNPTVNTQAGGPTLALALSGDGSFRFSFPYTITVTAAPGTPEGTYNGTLALGSSPVASDNRTIPVVFTVTSQPIAQLSQESVNIRVAQNGPKQKRTVVVNNRGQGTLAVTGATAAAGSGGSWLAVDAAQNGAAGLVNITVDPSGLALGNYTGTVTVASNAANPVTIPVLLTVVAPGPPTVTYQGVVDNATFAAGDTLAQGDIAAVFGDQFTSGDPAGASALPLGLDLGGVRVFLNDQPVPVYYVSYNQINFQVPYEASVGDGTLRIERGGQRGNTVSVRIASSAPRLLRLGIGDYGIAVFPDLTTFVIPATSGIPSRPAHAGDTIVLYAIGLGPTTPSVTTGAGAPASPLAVVNPAPAVCFGGGLFDPGICTQPQFAGLTPGFVGLYQVNVVIPAGVPAGDKVSLYLQGLQGASNRVQIAIQ